MLLIHRAEPRQKQALGSGLCLQCRGRGHDPSPASALQHREPGRTQGSRRNSDKLQHCPGRRILKSGDRPSAITTWGLVIRNTLSLGDAGSLNRQGKDFGIIKWGNKTSSESSGIGLVFSVLPLFAFLKKKKKPGFTLKGYTSVIFLNNVHRAAKLSTVNFRTCHLLKRKAIPVVSSYPLFPVNYWSVWICLDVLYK